MATIEMGKLRVDIVNEGDKRKLSIFGNINEDLDIQKISQDKGNSYIVDFGGVKMINSCGIREWIRFVEAIGKNTPIEYHNCPQIIVQQMNMVAGFLSAQAKVISFYAPYFCEDNDEERHVLIQTSQVVGGKAPKVTTQVNGQTVEMEFDAIEDQYFKFLKK
jgi:hypothetical protein